LSGQGGLYGSSGSASLGSATSTSSSGTVIVSSGHAATNTEEFAKGILATSGNVTVKSGVAPLGQAGSVKIAGGSSGFGTSGAEVEIQGGNFDAS